MFTSKHQLSHPFCLLGLGEEGRVSGRWGTRHGAWRSPLFIKGRTSLKAYEQVSGAMGPILRKKRGGGHEGAAQKQDI